ncbi:ankyrin repeat domain-containing protein [Armatimonas sp.]|uniref:ankyrin repeat domain-containing protein n=1 Tax=Armatimonas sp. TaxID=1872638 RepID=UPI00374DDA69
MTDSEFLTAASMGDEALAHAALAANPALASASTPDGLPVSLLTLYHGRKALAELIGEARRETLSIFEAAALGRIRDVSVLLHLHRDRALEVSHDGFTALHLAAFFGHHYCAKLLLEEHADPNAISKNAMRVTPLHSAVADKPESVVAPLVALLLNAKANPNATQADGFTPLKVAQQNGHAQVEKLLRAKGAV